MKFSWVLLFITGILICTYVVKGICFSIYFNQLLVSLVNVSQIANPGRQSWGGHGNDNWNRNNGGGNHGGGHHWGHDEGSSAASQAQSQALNVDIVANPDGTFGVSHSASQAEAMAASGVGSNRPGNGHGKGNNKGSGGSASVSQAQSQTVNVNIINAPKVTV